MDKPSFDRTDYSVVVKNRGRPAKAWRWEIYRAGRSSPIKQSLVYFDTMAAANRAGRPEAVVGKAARLIASNIRVILPSSPKGAGDGRFEE